VRIALQRWLTRICEDPVLLKDDEVRSFIESDFGVSFTQPVYKGHELTYSTLPYPLLGLEDQ
jgi:hypothetical protein